VLALTLLVALGAALGGRPAYAEERPWRGGWAGLRDPEMLLTSARELGFTALILNAPKERLGPFAETARAQGIECYYWFSLTSSDKAMEPYRQVMGEADERRFAELQADADPRKHGYQFGGEPQPGNHEVLLTRLLCFHRPEVVDYARQKVREMLEACPALTGIAFDYFGYQNYRCCLCPQSRVLFDEYRRAHPDLAEDTSRDRFSLATLVTFNNELAAFVRQVRPGAKVATHVYPVFLPEPLYGNRLDVDYCCQTVAWFFEPYWSAEKIAKYTRVVVEEQNRYHPRAQGIPFVGVYVGRPSADKSAARLAEELRTIREAGNTTRFSVCGYNDLAAHEDLRAVVRRAFGLPDPPAERSATPSRQ